MSRIPQAFAFPHLSTTADLRLASIEFFYIYNSRKPSHIGGVARQFKPWPKIGDERLILNNHDSGASTSAVVRSSISRRIEYLSMTLQNKADSGHMHLTVFVGVCKITECDWGHGRLENIRILCIIFSNTAWKRHHQARACVTQMALVFLDQPQKRIHLSQYINGAISRDL